MAILNYTTQIKPEKTIAEIETMLAQTGANKILKDYDGEGNVETISFMIETPQGIVPVKLPLKLKAVMQVINTQTGEYRRTNSGQKRVIPQRYYNDMDQARRVGWRIIKDWLEVQLALIQLEMVKFQEIFLPYIIRKDGKTVYEEIEAQGFKDLLLEGPEKEGY